MADSLKGLSARVDALERAVVELNPGGSIAAGMPLGVAAARAPWAAESRAAIRGAARKLGRARAILARLNALLKGRTCD